MVRLLIINLLKRQNSERRYLRSMQIDNLRTSLVLHSTREEHDFEKSLPRHKHWILTKSKYICYIICRQYNKMNVDSSSDRGEHDTFFFLVPTQKNYYSQRDRTKWVFKEPFETYFISSFGLNSSNFSSKYQSYKFDLLKISSALELIYL
jgi:hypothetical protein